jgi:uncharacterized protein (TIGR02118 family)
MIKLIGVFRKRPDLTSQQFQEYYETKHVPLILDLLPRAKHYKRSYIASSEWAAPPFDVITEVCHESREALAASRQRLISDEVARRIRADEANFLDRTSLSMYVVDERVSF